MILDHRVGLEDIRPDLASQFNLLLLILMIGQLLLPGRLFQLVEA